MDVVSPYSNGVPEDTPEDSPKQCEDNHRNREVGVANHRLKDVVSPSRNGIPKGLPNNSKSSHWNREVDEKQAEESLSLYCKPVELYNIIQQRSESQVGPFADGRVVFETMTCGLEQICTLSVCFRNAHSLLFSGVISLAIQISV